MTRLQDTSTTRIANDLVESGQRVYDEQLKTLLEASHFGRFVAIEPQTARYFLGDAGTEALVAARAQMPDAQFYLARIGYRAAHTIGGHTSRIR
ncbi:MAG TPA: hypothetical protein VJH03_02295 [Blastocatellia bacterium]|nr:hypothetical protein [Blastocatellia bacterium]